jgi:hypothetical protein
MAGVRRTTRPGFTKMVLWGFVAGCAALALVGCKGGGTLYGGEQSCRSNFGLLDPKKVSCTGSVDTVGGSPGLRVIETGGDLTGAYRLEVTIEVGHGTAKAHVTDIDDKQVGGEVSPGDPLRIVAVVYPQQVPGTEDEEEVEVDLEVVEGKELRDLRYEATLVEQG